MNELLIFLVPAEGNQQMTSTTTTHRLLLVGSHFHRPAKTLLAALPQGAEVRLTREPTNPYDPQAIRVTTTPDQLEWGTLESLVEELEGSGYTLREVREGASWNLGHVGASNGKPLEKARRAGIEDLWGNSELLAAVGDAELPVGRLLATSEGIYIIEVET